MSNHYFEPYYSLLSSVFSPILPPIFQPAVSVFIISVILTFILILPFKFLINQTRVQEIKSQQKEKQQKIKELQKTNPQEATKVMNEILTLNNSLFRLNMKPLILTFVVALAILPWLSTVFTQPVAQIPFSIPFLGNELGWLVWYIIISLPLNQIFRKILNIT